MTYRGRLKAAGERFLWILCCAAIAPVDADALRHRLIAASQPVLSEPHDLVLSPDGRLLYVADNGNDRVAVLDPHSLAFLMSFGEGELSQPHDVAFDRQGRLLVADTGNSRIAIYEMSGSEPLLAAELTTRLHRPEGVEALDDGRVLATGAASGNLVMYRDGQVIAETGGLSAPHDVALGPNGGIWVADAGNDRLLRFDQALKPSGVLSGAPYAFSGPRYLDFDAAGRMYVADKYHNQVKVIDLEGTLVAIIGAERGGQGEGLFDRPEGVEIHEDSLWFSDTYNDRVVRYRVAMQ